MATFDHQRGLHARCTLLLLIFAGLNFRDFRDFQKIAKLKTREKRLSRKITPRTLKPIYIVRHN